MRLYCKNINKLFDTLVLILSTEEIMLLIPEFEKLVNEENYTIQSHSEDSEFKKMKKMILKIYNKHSLSKSDDHRKNIILEKI